MLMRQIVAGEATMSDTKEDMSALDASEGAIRTSFSLDRYARERIRETAQKYGVSQAEIVNRSARLFEFLAERSLQRRAQNLRTLQTLAEQVERSLEAMAKMAPHLAGAFAIASNQVTDALESEESGIKTKQVFGSSEGGDFDLDFTDRSLIEKVLETELPELGPSLWLYEKPEGNPAPDIHKVYAPYGPLSSRKPEYVPEL
jgi:hypothetical protein